ncbi:nuclear transport factor 2 family protein [Flavihumibacter fluvii]|uniref:nuclear transport factor 2 family protein n=1 Tax=Flavihumibacter fluvii TaxID=2838157 RepID=UPI001BDF592C|nr:nuclear transport factor 2 family protein [Flavihumibacter fluvii]ULQ54716.1 nuclear transport factor 2 family protein [Flavihumibacter fluvii]
MKVCLLLMTTFLMSACAANAQEKLSASQKAVQKTVMQLFDALSNRDSISLKAACTNDITLFEYGQTWNLDTLVLKAITQNTATDFKRVNTIDFIDTKVDKNLAYTTYNNRAEITSGGINRNITWLETVILSKEKNQWKVKVLHSTLINRK